MMRILSSRRAYAVRVAELRRRLKESEAKLAKYRAALEHKPNITEVADWIAEVEHEAAPSSEIWAVRRPPASRSSLLRPTRPGL